MHYRLLILTLLLLPLAACSPPQPTHAARPSYGPPDLGGFSGSGAGNISGPGNFMDHGSSRRTGSTSGMALPSNWSGFSGQ